jgi:hypothetical protein
MKLWSRLALATLLGLALTTWVGTGQAGAQGKMKKDTKSTKTKTMDDHKTMAGDQMMDTEEAPALHPTPSYPMLAPGEAHSHWGHHMMGAGSSMAGDTTMGEEAHALSTTPSYPMLAPGMAHSHWGHHAMMSMSEGSESESMSGDHKMMNDSKPTKETKMKGGKTKK